MKRLTTWHFLQLKLNIRNKWIMKLSSLNFVHTFGWVCNSTCNCMLNMFMLINMVNINHFSSVLPLFLFHRLHSFTCEIFHVFPARSLSFNQCNQKHITLFCISFSAHKKVKIFHSFYLASWTFCLTNFPFCILFFYSVYVVFICDW